MALQELSDAANLIESTCNKLSLDMIMCSVKVMMVLEIWLEYAAKQIKQILKVSQIVLF